MLIKLRNESDTEEFARRFQANIRGGELIGLIGPLGAGKTTFARYLCSTLGCTEPVSSPTFVLEHEYHGPKLRIEHWDLYRLSSLPEELLQAPELDVVRLIEWVDKFGLLAQTCDYRIIFSVGSNQERAIKVESQHQDLQ